MIYFIITSIIPGGYLTAEDTYYFLNITAALITVVYIQKITRSLNKRVYNIK